MAPGRSPLQSFGTRPLCAWSVMIANQSFQHQALSHVATQVSLTIRKFCLRNLLLRSVHFSCNILHSFTSFSSSSFQSCDFIRWITEWFFHFYFSAWVLCRTSIFSENSLQSMLMSILASFQREEISFRISWCNFFTLEWWQTWTQKGYSLCDKEWLNKNFFIHRFVSVQVKFCKLMKQYRE